MKKNVLLSSLLFAALFLGINSAQAAPPPPGVGGPHGGLHGPSAMHKPSMHNHVHQPPRMHHHHHVRHYSGFISPYYYSSYYPVGYYGTNIYYPMRNHGHLGATFHISL